MTEMLQDAPTAAEGGAAVAAGNAPVAANHKGMRKKRRKKIVRWAIILLVLGALVYFGMRRFGGKEKRNREIMTDFVQVGSISSTVTGSGLAKASSSETITLTTAGTVMDVFVTEGQFVEAGERLFTIDSPSADTEVQNARTNVEGIRKQYHAAQKNLAGLNLAAPHAGKLLETAKLHVGDEIGAGVKVATLADDTRMRLTQYFSYAYADSIRAGQSVEVSIPALMTTVSGTVEAVHLVSRVTPEGSKLFSADVVIPNAGVLAVDMTASATAIVNGEPVYPYEAGKLEYYRVSEISTTVGGTILSENLIDYMSVSEGQVLVRIDGEEGEAELFSIKQRLEEAEKKLDDALKNQASCRAVAPIAGQVIGLGLYPGQTLTAGMTLVSICDTSRVVISAAVDERNISYVKVGAPVTLDQWGTPAFGTVETVSLSSTVSGGVATYPVTISADNAEGTLQINSYVNYSLVASQSENCLILPLQAVRTESTEEGDTVTVVYVRADSRPENAVDLPYAVEEIPDGFYPVPVEIGIQDNVNVEIKSGVEEGTEVFTQMMTTEVWG